MGCDIHCYVEYYWPGEDHSNGKKRWRDFGQRINPGRNYTLFGYLAGVRRDVTPVVPPRGVPRDLAWAASDDYWLWLEGKDRARAARWVEQGDSVYRHNDAGEPQWVSHPDYHTHSWLTPDEFEKALVLAGETTGEYRALLAAMRSLEKDGDKVRLVFWFDN